MNIDFVYILAVAFGIGIAFVLMPSKPAWEKLLLCLCFAFLGLLITGMAEIDERGDKAMAARILDPLSNILATITGIRDGERSVNPCPPERNLGQYGESARYDGILIEGSPEFVSRVVTALNRLYDTPSYRYAKALRIIEERDLPRRIWAQVSGRHAMVSPRAAARSCTLLASTIAHEGAHVIHGSGHGPVYAAQAQALEEMGEPHAAQSALRMARNSY